MWTAILHTALRWTVRSSWSRLPFDEVVRRFGTPEGINRYMQVCFEYIHDHELHGRDEVWQTPALTHRLQRGDCEDFALYAWSALHRRGWDTCLFAAFTRELGHAVCVYRDRDGYHTICNEGLKKLAVSGPPSEGSVPADEVAHALAAHIYEDWESCSFVDGSQLAQHPERHELVPSYRWIRRR